MLGAHQQLPQCRQHRCLQVAKQCHGQSRHKHGAPKTQPKQSPSNYHLSKFQLIHQQNTMWGRTVWLKVTECLFIAHAELTELAVQAACMQELCSDATLGERASPLYPPRQSPIPRADIHCFTATSRKLTAFLRPTLFTRINPHWLSSPSYLHKRNPLSSPSGAGELSHQLSQDWGVRTSPLSADESFKACRWPQQTACSLF